MIIAGAEQTTDRDSALISCVGFRFISLFLLGWGVFTRAEILPLGPFILKHSKDPGPCEGATLSQLSQSG